MPIDVEAGLEAALGHPLPPDARLAVAVSGGPDSLALLLLAAAAFPGRIHGLTVDHGLRAAAAAEAADVAAICAARGIGHATLRWRGDKPAANRQAAARAARYALMVDWCVANGHGLLLTAHHADDQAETLLMRLARGAGNGGLAGIRPCRPLGGGVLLVRPLLGTRRSALASVVAGAGLTPVDDPANSDPAFDRTAARVALAALPWLDAERVAASAAHLAEAEAALAWTADRAWAGAATASPDGVTLDIAGLPAELTLRLLRRALATLSPDTVPRGDALMRLVATLAAGGTATLVGVRARGGAIWRFSPARPRG